MRVRCKAQTVHLLLLILGGCSGVAFAGENNRLELGRTSTGVSVIFAHTGSGWGIEVQGSGSTGMSQSEPARIEVSNGPGNLRELGALRLAAQSKRDFVR